MTDASYGGYFTSWDYRGLYARGDGTYYAAYLDGPVYVNGNLYASGSKAGYVVDVALNQGPESLERGDVVVIAGVASPVFGDIPVVEVRKAGELGSSAVMGVVDGPFSPPDSDSEGETSGDIHSGSGDSPIQAGEYLTVVTLGAFQAVKVDAGYTAISPGDLLVSSATPGYAMKAVDPAPGTIIGKALDSLAAGQGSIPILITLQ